MKNEIFNYFFSFLHFGFQNLIFEYLMLKTVKSLNLKKALFIFYKFLCWYMKFIYDHKKTCVKAKILGNLLFLGGWGVIH